MSNFDDLFADKKATNEKPATHAYSKEEWIAKKQAERSAAFELLNDATEEAKQNSEKFRDYLNIQSRFDRYSVSNALMVAHQKPDATKLADFDTWKDSDISILKGAKAITILEPGNEYTREDGTTGFSVNAKKVFDISQTSEAESVQKPTFPNQRMVMKALIAASPCDIRMTDEVKEGLSAEYVQKDNVIYVRQGLDGDDMFRSLAQEIAMAKLVNGNESKDAGFVAYCTSFILCERNGFDNGAFTFDGVDKYAEKMDAKEFRGKLDKVRDTVNEMSQDINRSVEEQQKAKRSREEAR